MRRMHVIRYSIRVSKYLERVTLFNLTHKMHMDGLVALDVDTLKVNNGCPLEKQFTKLIHRKPLMVLYLTVNHIDSCHDCICASLT